MKSLKSFLLLIIGLAICMSVRSQVVVPNIKFICGDQPTPQGWVVINFSSPCTGSRTPSKVIQQIEGMAPGSRVEVCGEEPTPSGWVIISYMVPCIGSASPKRLLEKIEGMPPGVEREICGEQPTPTGWIITSYTIGCSGPGNPGKRIQKIDGMSPGVSMPICGGQPTPEGWVITGYTLGCSSPGNPGKTIQKIEGLSCYATVTVCGEQPVPAGWTILSYGNPCGAGSLPSKMIRKTGPLSTFYRDNDHDGFGGTSTTLACGAPQGYVSKGGDCNDNDPSIFPGAFEVCDGKDNNCSGTVDEGVQVSFFRDQDNDGFGGPYTILACSPPQGYVSKGGDCDDSNPLVYPGSSTSSEGWLQKASVSGVPRFGGVGFVIGSKFFVGCGEDANDHFLNDWWCFDVDNARWTRIANLPADPRYMAVGLAIEGKGYVFTGHGSAGHLKDVWQYDPVANVWTPKADYPGGAGFEYFGFTVENKAYVGSAQLWEYDPRTNIWIRKADPASGARSSAATFTIGTKAYMGTGSDENGRDRSDFWCYDAKGDNWSRIADYPHATTWCTGFALSGKGYVSSGWGFYEFDPVKNNWTKKPNGPMHLNSVAGAIGSKGYLSTGRGASIYNDLWQFSSSSACPATTSVSSLSSLNKANSTADVDSAAHESSRHKIPELTVAVRPNPAMHYFTLTVSSLNSDPVLVRVRDIAGRIVETKAGVPPNCKLQLGHEYRTGLYFVEVLQGKQVKTLKLIKQSN